MNQHHTLPAYGTSAGTGRVRSFTFAVVFGLFWLAVAALVLVISNAVGSLVNTLFMVTAFAVGAVVAVAAPVAVVLAVPPLRRRLALLLCRASVVSDSAGELGRSLPRGTW